MYFRPRVSPANLPPLSLPSACLPGCTPCQPAHLPARSLLQMHLPYLVGEGCYIPVIKDSMFNTWHQIT